jgi:O-antigen/teichoic acid export membrane protein
MCLVPAAGALVSIISEALKAADEPSYIVRISAVLLVVTVVAMIALQPFGLTAAAAGLSIGELAAAVYSFHLMNTVVGVEIKAMVTAIWRPAFAALVASVGVLCLEAFVVDAESHRLIVGLILLAGEALIGVVAYLAILEVMDPSLVTKLLDGGKGAWHRVVRRRGGDPTTRDLDVDAEPETLIP